MSSSGSSGFVTPDSFSDGGIPIFRPSIEQFSDFYRFVKACNPYGMQSGIIKVVPPPEWVQMLQSQASVDASDQDLQRLKNVRIQRPIQQQISGEKGVYVVHNIEKNKSFDLVQWANLAHNYALPSGGGVRDSSAPQKVESVEELAQTFASGPTDPQFLSSERVAFLENYYWKTLNFTTPLYGADTPGSLFDPDFGVWNVARLPNVLDALDKPIPGVNEAYLYAGLWKASYTWHTEDKELYSINYIHHGAPKQWYSIPQSHHDAFMEYVHEQFPDEFKACPEFLRHKQVLISPKTLREHGIPVNKVVHYQHEFIITFPRGLHAGFNYGLNLAESVNFATDDWFDIGEQAHPCHCVSDSVDIDVAKLRENWENNKNKRFNDLLTHSSQELQNIHSSSAGQILDREESTGPNSALQPTMPSSGIPTKENSMAPLFANLNMPNMSLRSTSPSINQPINQGNPSLSRVSSPFLSRMMDLSNIIEPTLDDATLKRRLVSPQPMRSQQQQQQGAQQQSQLQQRYQGQTSQGAMPLAPLEVRSFGTPSSALFDYNDDNLLALSLTSMANSGNSSPRMRKPMLNSPIDHFGNSSAGGQVGSSLRPLFSSSAGNGMHQLAYETAPLSGTTSRLMNGINYSNNVGNSSTNSPLLQSYPSNYNIPSPSAAPFIKRPKSSNIVTLNISRESSRSPIPMGSIENQNTNQGIPNNNGNTSNNINSNNHLKYSSLNQIEQPGGRIPMDNNGMPLTKKQKLGKRILSSPSSGLATAIPITTTLLSNNDTTALTANNNNNNSNENGMEIDDGRVKQEINGHMPGASIIHTHPTKFASDEIVVSKFGKVYICQECKRQFSSGHHLTRHKKSVHSGEKPYSCPKCGKRFKRRDHVLQHLNKKIPCVPTPTEAM